MVKSKTSKKGGVSASEVVGFGAGIAAISAAAYIMFGPDAKKNRKAIRGWAVKMKGEIIEKLEQAKEITEPVYHKIVDEVQAKYAKTKNVDSKELEAIVVDIKKHWKSIEKDAKVAVKGKASKAKGKKK
jgi:hypothetical protein